MLKGLARNTERKITYPNIDSALRPVPHDPSMPAPLCLEDGLTSLADEMVFNKLNNLALSYLTGSEYEPEE